MGVCAAGPAPPVAADAIEAALHTDVARAMAREFGMAHARLVRESRAMLAAQPYIAQIATEILTITGPLNLADMGLRNGWARHNDVMRLVAVCLAQSSATGRLNMTEEDFRGGSAAILCAGLARNSTLQELWFSFSRLGDSGAMALGRALRTNQGLEVVNLVRCGITARGAIALIKGAANHPKLCYVDLGCNNVSKWGMWRVVRAGIRVARTNQVLRAVRLHENPGEMPVGEMQSWHLDLANNPVSIPFSASSD